MDDGFDLINLLEYFTEMNNTFPWNFEQYKLRIIMKKLLILALDHPETNKCLLIT